MFVPVLKSTIFVFTNVLVALVKGINNPFKLRNLKHNYHAK